jgi:tripartite ATP-independent transporter DctP family solute receptor
MSRARWLMAIGLVLIAHALCQDKAIGAQTRVLKLGFILAAKSQLGAGAQAFAEAISQRTGGRYRVELYPNAALGGEVEMVKAIQLGAVDAAFITGAPLPNFLPEIGVFNIPFLFRDVKHARSVLDGPIGQSYLEKFRSKDLIALAWGENGMRHLTNSKHEIKSPDDLKGLKLRLPQSEVMAAGFKALGATVIALPFPQVYGALQSGEVDGQENPIATIQASKFYQVQKFLSLTAHVYDPAILFISTDLFDDLSSEDKRSFVDAAKLAGKVSRDFASAAEAEGVTELERAGMKAATEIDRQAFQRAMMSAQPHFEKVFGKAIIEEIQKFH